VAVRVEGLGELRRAFYAADRALGNDLDDALEEAAVPVRSDAQTLAVSSIRRIGPDWSRMRIGTTRTIVYVAPVERGAKGRGNQRYRRPKFKRLLLSRSLEPALDRNLPQVTRRVDQMLGELSQLWQRTK
jgi:hypothetical protein